MSTFSNNAQLNFVYYQYGGAILKSFLSDIKRYITETESVTKKFHQNCLDKETALSKYIVVNIIEAKIEFNEGSPKKYNEYKYIRRKLIIRRNKNKK